MLMDYVSSGGTGPVSEDMTKREVALRLRRTTRTIENWMRLGRLPFLKINGQVSFHWPTVERHLQENYAVVRPTERIRLGLRRRSRVAAPTA